MKKYLIQFFLGVLIFVSLLACDQNKVFEDYKPIPGASWNKDSLVTFNFLIGQPSQQYNLYFNVRNKISYSYSNLWLFAEIVRPDGSIVKDTFEITLAEPSGKWLGEGFGGLKTRQVIYRRNYSFPKSGEYKISIQQGMREDNLKGISDIGFRVEKTR